MLSCALALAGTPMFDAVEALKRGDFAGAERSLRTEIGAHPNEAEALSLLGVALDSQNKFKEADAFHRRALGLAPRSNSVLDKYGSHLLASGDENTARDIFLKAVALNPADAYANLELGQIALKHKDGPRALSYLNRLSPGQKDDPDVAVKRVIALELSGQTADANTLFAGLPVRSAAAGSALAEAGLFDKAETIFESLLAADPSNLKVMYNLGSVASRAGHYARAREVLGTALRQQPRNADVLYALAWAEDAAGQRESAFRWLAQAAQVAPERADVQRLLAIVAGDIHAYQDSVTAWERYAALSPGDATGRRERGFARAHAGQLEAGIADLRDYTARHTDDAIGFYELGVAESAADPTRGLSSFDRAVALKPDFAAARSARGALYYREGKPEAALPDLERASALEPGDAMIEDRLGQVYLALDRLNDALRLFRRATELAPNDYAAHVHLANALAEMGQTTESESIMERIRTWPVQKPTAASDLLDGGSRVRR